MVRSHWPTPIKRQTLDTNKLAQNPMRICDGVCLCAAWTPPHNSTQPIYFGLSVWQCKHIFNHYNRRIVGVDIRNAKREDAGKVLSDTLRQFMYDLKVDNGLNAVGYTKDDIPELVRGTLPQVIILRIFPFNT